MYPNNKSNPQKNTLCVNCGIRFIRLRRTWVSEESEESRQLLTDWVCKKPDLLAFGKHCHSCGKWMQRRALRKDVTCNFCNSKIFVRNCKQMQMCSRCVECDNIIHGLRCQLRELESKPLGDEEFIGCSATEVGHATRRSDDSSDGNPQQSAVGDGTRPHTLTDAASWQPGGLDVRALARTVLGALPPSPTPLPFNEVLRRTARTDAEVSHVLLSTLFLASAGNVHIEAGAPLTVNSFSVRLLHSELPAGEPGDPFLQ